MDVDDFGTASVVCPQHLTLDVSGAVGGAYASEKFGETNPAVAKFCKVTNTLFVCHILVPKPVSRCIKSTCGI